MQAPKSVLQYSVMKTASIFEEIDGERQHQADRFAEGSLEKLEAVDTEKNGPNDFVAYVAAYSSKWFPGGFGPFNRDALVNFRKSMLKTAALAVSAIIWVDKKLAE